VLGWLTLDAVQWLNAQGVVKVQDITWYNKNAARCWFIGLLCALTADLYRLRNTVQRLSAIEKGGAKMLAEETDLKKEHAALLRYYMRIYKHNSVLGSKARF
jgi:hypothetical protein